MSAKLYWSKEVPTYLFGLGPDHIWYMWPNIPGGYAQRRPYKGYVEALKPYEAGEELMLTHTGATDLIEPGDGDLPRRRMGRPVSPEGKMQHRDVMIDDTRWEALGDHPDGKSAAIREAIDLWRARQQEWRHKRGRPAKQEVR